ncbi:uncharacterized protein LOC141640044 [Silene latifolia]|uniref:uncharacterized protein LOC141640044 n=1 Tax=Silene latifolia TaxID=37657 RepID=UPI003D780867
MRKPELSGRMVKWSVHLSGYDLKFEPQTAIKSQALVDFVSDFRPTLQEQADSEILTLSEDKREQVWELHVDGASNTKVAGVGLVLKSPQGEQIIQAVRCEFKATNNEAEYEALILGLQLALEMQINHIKVHSDSQLIVNHVNKVYTGRDPKMVAYLEVANEIKLRFASFHIKQIPRDQNVEVDALATLGAAFTQGVVGTISFIHVMKPTIRQNEQQNNSKAATTQWTYEAGILCTATPQEETDDWRKPYISWLRDEIEAQPFPQILEKHVISFIKRNIGSKYGIPSEIICDNRSQFISNKTEDYCARWNIKLFKSTPRNPQSNSQAEFNNKIVMKNLKRRLEEIGANWADEIPFVLWSDRTTPKVATGQTPFSLVYGAEAVIPPEVKIPTHRYVNATEERNQVQMASSMDTID